MKSGLFAVVALFVATGAACADPALTGVWRAVEAERNGAAAPDLVGHVLTFDGGAFRIVDAQGAFVYGGTFVADPGTSPFAIDFVLTEGAPAGQTWLGIYALDGDDGLTVVDNAPDPTRPRPGDFKAGAGSGYVAVTFEKAD